jgi:hypothetical protein
MTRLSLADRLGQEGGVEAISNAATTSDFLPARLRIIREEQTIEYRRISRVDCNGSRAASVQGYPIVGKPGAQIINL